MPSDPRTRRALAHASRALGDHDIAPQATARTPAEALEHATASIRGAPESQLLELRAHAFRLVADMDIRDYGACRACGIYARLHAAAGSTRPLLCSRCATETWRLRIRPPRWASLGPVLLAAAGLEPGERLAAGDHVVREPPPRRRPRR